MTYTYAYPRPAVTVDVVLLVPAEQSLQVLLIKRRAEPFKNHWALPGGFLDMDEELSTAARRELQEETGLQVGKLVEIGAFGKVGRDPRGRTISIAYLAVHNGQATSPRAGDDAVAADWFNCDKLPPLAFDHADILQCAQSHLQTLAKQPKQLSEALLPAEVTFDDLHAVFQAVLGRSIVRATLRQRLRRVGVLT